jgi:hypothetical protein
MVLSNEDVEELLEKTVNTLEALTNITFLTVFDSDRPEKVRSYMALAEGQLKSLAQVVNKHLLRH